MGRKSCCSKEEVNRGPWSFQEDEILKNYINTHGDGRWRALPLKAGLNRCGKSCRLRWLNYLSPEIKRGNISKDEEDLIIRLHTLLGNRWSLIARRLPGRTDNEIKNYWNTNLAKRLSCQNSTSISAQKRSKTLEKQKVIHDQVSTNNNSLPIRTKAIRHSNFKSHINQDQGIHHRQIAANNMPSMSNEGINCDDTNTPNSSVVHSGDPAIMYEDVERLMAFDHDHGQCSSNNTNTASTPQIEETNDPLGFRMDLDARNINIVFEEDQIDLQNTNLGDHFPTADNGQSFKMNDDDEDDPNKRIRSLPYSDLLIDANGIEIKVVDKGDVEQEMKGEPNMEINLMHELKKIAYFLELEDDWNNI